MQDNIPSKWKPKEYESCHSMSGKINCNLKRDNKRQRWALYNEKGTTDQKHILNVNTYVPNHRTQRHYSNY